MSGSFTSFAVIGALFVAGCAPTLPPSQAPVALRDAYAESIFVVDAAERCSGFVVDDAAMDDRFEDILAEMIDAGFSSAQFEAFMAGLFFEDDWFIPYAVRFERENDLELVNDAAFCRQMDRERRNRTSIGRMLL